MHSKPWHRLAASIAAVLTTAASAREGPQRITERDTLNALSQTLQAQAIDDRRQALRIARRAGLPVRKHLPGGGVMELQRFIPGRGPVYYITHNIDAADTVSTDELWPGGSTGLNLDGAGMLIGEWDAGTVKTDHADLSGRVTLVDYPEAPLTEEEEAEFEIANHATHVAGTLVGSGAGLLPNARGMAWAADLHAWTWQQDAAEMSAAAADVSDPLLVSNHSYGLAAGWAYTGEAEPGTWLWFGGSDPADTEDPNFGYYDDYAQTWDTIAWNAPYYLIVKAAGNDGVDIGPEPGESYTVVDQDGEALFVSDLPREPDCTPAGFDCLPTFSVAKNILTVGAVDDVPGGYSAITGANAVKFADFSSRGPSDDGRIKPDLVGNGVLLLSAWVDLPGYAAVFGTSQAAPNVSGSLLLLQQHHENLHGADQYLRAATLKALAIHTADEAGAHPGPDYWFGWGLLNARTAAEVISEDGADHLIIEDNLADGAVNTHLFSASGVDTQVVATLVWADPPATPVAPSLDPPDLMLVNDLDLRIEYAATDYLPWVLDPANPAAAATTGDNVRDNVEQVVVTGAGAGQYSVRVSHKGGLLDGAAQDYALIISERPAPPAGAVTLIDENFEDGLPVGWTVTTEGGVDWEIRTPVAEDPRYDNLTGADGQFAMVDNNYANTSYTGLESPVLDLSDRTAVVLLFKSYYIYDTFETINVEVSIDGGASWTNAWQSQELDLDDGDIVLDLSEALAGEASARFRFWWDSVVALSGDLWQVDDVRLEVYGGDTPTQDELCSGTDVLIHDHVFTGVVNCVATSSLTLGGGTTVASGADVNLSAPHVTLQPSFSVEHGALLSVDTQGELP